MAHKKLHEYDIDEILKYVQSQRTIDDRVKALQAGSTGKGDSPLKRLLKAAYDAEINWLLPEGEVPYNATSESSGTQRLSMAVKKLHYYVEGGYPNLKQERREMLFIRALESVNKTNQSILLHAKDQRLHDLFTKITPDVVTKAFPDLIHTPVGTKKSAGSKSAKTPGGGNKKNQASSTTNQQGGKTAKKTKAEAETDYISAADPEKVAALDPNLADED